jgi:hypothetical protein
MNQEPEQDRAGHEHQHQQGQPVTDGVHHCAREALCSSPQISGSGPESCRNNW